MRELRWSWLWHAIGWGLVVLIIYLSLTPEPPDALHLDAWDKYAHLLAYGVLMGWFVLLYEQRGWLLGLALAFVLMGIALEFVQGVLGARMFDPHDMLANTLGVLLGLTLWPTPLARLLTRL